MALFTSTRHAAAAAPPKWSVPGCEGPSVYYSPSHVPGAVPCCEQAMGLCAGGGTCSATGRCGDGSACVPGSLADRPNLLLFVSDDQAYCDYGFMGQCRTSRVGTVIPAPYTPALDALAGSGKMFPVAHNAAPWCLPSRATILTGKLPAATSRLVSPPGSLAPGVTPGSAATPIIPQLLERDPGTGGGLYCTFRVGKYGGGAQDPLQSIDASSTSSGLGRMNCKRCGADVYEKVPPDCDETPKCGDDIGAAINTGDLDTFLDALLVGRRDFWGRIVPGRTYWQPQPFFAWYGTSIPHTPINPPDVVEHVPHAPLATSHDFLFGPESPGSGVPRFPFGDARYAAAFAEPNMPGRYGNVWMVDQSLAQVQALLAGRRISNAACVRGRCNDAPARSCDGDDDCNSMAARTVIIFLADNGAFLPDSKHAFTENGYRTSLIVSDPRRTSGPGENRVETEIAHGKDVLPTLLTYGGVPVPPDMPGVDLGAWVDGTRAVPVRNTLCGAHVAGNTSSAARYLLTRAGLAGRCVAPGGKACREDGGCPPGTLCTGTPRTCVTPKAVCLGDSDCPAGARCVLRDRKWCRYGASADSPLRSCANDDDCRDALCSESDPLACTCEYRQLKLYVGANGMRVLRDLLVDPDENGLAEALVGPASSSATGPLVDRLRCCLDAWWTPDGSPGCGAQCDPAFACRP